MCYYMKDEEVLNRKRIICMNTVNCPIYTVYEQISGKQQNPMVIEEKEYEFEKKQGGFFQCAAVEYLKIVQFGIHKRRINEKELDEEYKQADKILSLLTEMRLLDSPCSEINTQNKLEEILLLMREGGKISFQ